MIEMVEHEMWNRCLVQSFKFYGTPHYNQGCSILNAVVKPSLTSFNYMAWSMLSYTRRRTTSHQVKLVARKVGPYLQSSGLGIVRDLEYRSSASFRSPHAVMRPALLVLEDDVPGFLLAECFARTMVDCTYNAWMIPGM
jgi:hypothetical protein